MDPRYGGDERSNPVATPHTEMGTVENLISQSIEPSSYLLDYESTFRGADTNLFY